MAMTRSAPGTLLQPIACEHFCLGSSCSVTSVMPALGTPPLPAHIKGPGPPSAILTNFFLLHHPLAPTLSTAPPTTTSRLDIAKTTPIMADGQAQPSGGSFAQPQVPHHPVAATTIGPLHYKPKASTNVGQDEGGQLDELCEMQEELPPYDSVSAERFVMDLNDIHDSRCPDMMRWLSNQRSYPSITECPTLGTYDDFILFPSSSSCSSEQDSSVASCFTDDLSCSTECTDTLSANPLMGSSLPSSQILRKLPLQGCCQDLGQDRNMSFANIENWLCDFEKDFVCTNLQDTFLHGAMTSTDPNKQEDASVEEPAT